ncbi:MAG: hypothetical protein RL226_1658 [Bacteroidota bacterium]|jgi:uncharacterized protein (DUF983 family)
MALKGTKLYSILAFRCPKCHTGRLFVDPNPYQFSQMTTMHDKCSCCGEDYKREPGFYFGAAYVSYALTVALWVAVLVALITFDALGWIEFAFFENPAMFLTTGVVTLILLLPVLFRLSRSIWINLFVKYDKTKGCDTPTK